LLIFTDLISGSATGRAECAHPQMVDPRIGRSYGLARHARACQSSKVCIEPFLFAINLKMNFLLNVQLVICVREGMKMKIGKNGMMI